MLLPATIALMLLVVGLAITRGPRVGLWAGWSLALLVPLWSPLTILSIRVDLISAVGIVALACFFATPWRAMFVRWVACDWLMILLMASQWMTFAAVDSVRPTIMAGSIFDWVVPYLVGRCALASRSDLDQMTKWLAIPIALIGVATTIECVTDFNILASYVGRAGPDMYRYGFTRAMGPTSHPIYLGMLMVLLLPWAIWGAFLGIRGEAPRWFCVLPLLCALGVMSSFSRGPFLAMCGVFVFVAFIHFRRYRTVIACSAVVLLLAVVLGRDMALESLRAADRTRSTTERPKMIVVDGELVEYDGTLHRLLLFKVYDDAIIEGGVLGHGPTHSDSVLDLVGGRAAGVMYSIDNHYIIYALRHGFLGLGAFLCLAGCGAVYGLQASFRSASPWNLFAATQFGSTVMVTLGLMTVWFPTDFRSMWLFSLGCAVAWRVHGIGNATQDSAPPPPPAARNSAVRRLVPGHPSMTTAAK